MAHSIETVAIIGAGMAGLSCAAQLAAAGKTVVILDKGRGPGGRMAARRAEIAGETVGFDHGAQFFTARDPSFKEAVREWQELGVVAPWPAAGDDAFVGTPGMNGPIRAMGSALGVEWGTRIEKLHRDGERWKLETGDKSFTADAIVCAVPAEQASVLLAEVAPGLAAAASQVQSAPCWAVMAAFEQKLGIEADCLRDPEAGISWAARNSAKPERNGEECWVLHASPERSREVLDLPKEEVAEILLADFFTQTGAAPAVPIHLTAHRWLYAMAEPVAGEPARYDADKRIGIAGDYLHSPRVEGAFLSGRALAAKMLG